MVPIKPETRTFRYIVTVVDQTEVECFTISSDITEAKGIAYGVYCMADKAIKVNIYQFDNNNNKKRIFTFGGTVPSQDEKTYANMHEPPAEVLVYFEDYSAVSKPV